MRALPLCREAAEGEGEQVARSGQTHFKKLKKIQFISKTLLGGSWEVSWGPGRVLGGSFAWKTEKLVDSMTSKLPPAPKMSFSPVLERSGPGLARNF